MTIIPSVANLAASYWNPPDEDGGDRELALACSRDLRILIREAWPILEPARPFVPAWHIDCVAEHLMAVSAGEIPRLLLNQPPGTTKSSLVAVLWPAWEWLLRPEVRWIFASYAETFAFRDSRKMRTLIQTRGGRGDGGLFERRGYQGVLALLGQGWQLTADQNAKGRYDTTATGMRLATSLAGQVTGDHGDRVVCLHGDTLIDTDRGALPIRDIVNRRLPVRVRGSSGRWQKIAKYEASRGRPLLEIETSDGARLRCTEDHPIYLEGHGWRPAATVISMHGDVHMRGLRSGVRQGAVARRTSQDAVLFDGLPDALPARGESPPLGRAGDAVLRALRATVSVQASRGTAAALLLNGLCDAGGPGTSSAGMRAVRSVVHPSASTQAAVLWSRLCRGGASDDGEGRGQRPIHPRRMADELHERLYGQAARCDPVAGRPPLCDLLRRESHLAGASHGRLEGQPRADQSRDALPLVSPQGAHEGGDQRRSDAPVRIVAVRRCGTPDAVYNLRVDPDHDYYADGLLVHNCDDPLNPKQAHSEADRVTTNRLWDETMSSRFIDESAAAVIVQQRLHERDMTGHLLAKEADWYHLCLPAEYVPAHPFTYPAKATLPSGRVIDGDPRTEPGELLDPVRLSAARLAKFRKDLGSYAFAGQFGQQPSPEGGGMFEKAWFTRRWKPGDHRYLELGWDRKIQSWDMAFKDTKGSDFVVGQLWGFHGADCYLLAQVRGRFDFTTTLHVVKALTDFDREAVAKLVEDKANGTAVINTLRSKVGGLIAIEPQGSKYARAGAVAPLSEAHNVILPAADTIPCPEFYVDADGRQHELAATTVADWLYEHTIFPAGAHDDQVDAMSQALTWANPRARPGVEQQPPGLPKPKAVMHNVMREVW